MCTDKTLKAKIKKYNDLSETVKALEKEKNALAAAIMPELIEREKTLSKEDIKKAFGVFRVAFVKESIKNEYVKEYAPLVWNEYHTKTSVEYIRKA